jgi:hypothetical protein
LIQTAKNLGKKFFAEIGILPLQVKEGNLERLGNLGWHNPVQV